MAATRNEDALTAPEVASILQVNRNTVYALAKSGELGSYHVGRKLRFTMRDVQAYIDSSRKSAGDMTSAGDAADAPTPALPREGALVVAGHDMPLDVLANWLSSLSLDVQRSYVGSYQALVELYQGRAHVAGVHLWDAESGTCNLPYVKRLLPGTPCIVFRMIRRTQGLLVRKGNPKNLRTWSDLLGEGVLIANREKGAGARVLLDEQLRMLEAPYASIEGYTRELGSEIAVATFVAQGLADVGIGSEKAFRHVPGLDYLPLVTESLDLVIVKTPQTKALIRTVRNLLTTTGFRAEFADATGIDVSRMGAVVYEC